MGLFGKRNLKLDDYEAQCIGMFKHAVIQTADDYRAASAKYLAGDAEKQKVLDARGPESMYMLTIHVMWNIVDYQIRVAEGRRASDGVAHKLFKWVLFAGSFEHPPIDYSKDDIKQLDRDTADRSATYHNEVLNKNGQLKQTPASIRSIEYLEQKAIPCFKTELAQQLGIADIDTLDPGFVAALVEPLYQLHETFDKFLQKNQIKPRS